MKSPSDTTPPPKNTSPTDPFYAPILLELARASRRPAGPRHDSSGHVRVFQGKDSWHIGIVLDGGYIGQYSDEYGDEEILEWWHAQLVALVDAIVEIREGAA